MPQFMLLMHQYPRDMSAAAPAEIEAVIAEYKAWSERLAQAGKLQDANKLTDEGGRDVVAKDGRVVVTDGPYSETKEAIGGYFVIEAGSYDEAVALCRDCPHLKFGGRIEVRRIDAM